MVHIQPSFSEFSAEFLRKQKRRQSLTDLWIQSESKWCEEANPFGLDMEEEESSAEGAQEAAKLGRSESADPGRFESGRTRADLRAQIQAGRSLLQARVRQLEQEASVQQSARSAARPVKQELICRLPIEDRIGEMKREREVAYQRFMSTVDRLGAIASDIRQRQRDCNATSRVSELFQKFQSKYSRDNEPSRSVADMVQAQVRKEVGTRPTFHARVRSASPTLLTSRSAFHAKSTKNLLAKRDEQLERLERLLEGSPKKGSAYKLPSWLDNSAVHSPTPSLSYLH
mmetsp:Transcript_150388/g.273685  ORF Transcript_150388/g.273685 Transcript_150388/m.273685 type:complete len:286 (-) Transcript_150388:206-1063(-)